MAYNEDHDEISCQFVPCCASTMESSKTEQQKKHRAEKTKREKSQPPRNQSTSTKKKRPSYQRTSQGLKQLSQHVPGWVASLILHVAAVLLLGYITLPLSSPPDLSLKTAHVTDEAFDLDDQLLEVDLELEQETLDETLEDTLETEPEVEILTEAFETTDTNPIEQVTEVVDFSATISDLETTDTSQVFTSSGFEGRSSAGKASLLRSGGGTKSSEKAVQQGLDWIARHQYPDGSWNFDHSKSECNGRCNNPGTYIESRAAATGLALLTYLGAGHTQEKGRYKRVVYRGIYALGNLIKLEKGGGSFWDKNGRMYSQGIATMAICEAYALTGEPALREPAQAAINYICYAQDPNGGGWRYFPQQPGDTSVLGWQIAALKSGYLSKLTVPSTTIQRASSYIDSMMVDGGKRYLYDLDPRHANDNRASTAIALLCRMYMGTDKKDRNLKVGIEALSNRGPSKTDAYHNYYAAQTLFHYTGGKGPMWKKWNEKMRGMLVDSQQKEGHEAGSWAPPQENYKSKAGGRLYTTCLSTMTLEVYYRMLPIYRDKAVAGEFEFGK